MKIVAATVVASIVALGAAQAQNSPAPKSDDAERNAFQTPTVGKDDRKQAKPSNTSGAKPGSSQSNPEARSNDVPSNKEKPATPSGSR